jgi:Coenzyme PQQ synthesis protein D (PqqD)
MPFPATAMTESAFPGDIQLSSAPAGRRTARLIELDGHALLYDDGLRHWVVLNPTAHALWRCLDGSGTVAEIADDLSAAFGAEPETVQEQVLHMVRVLGQQGLLEGVVPVPGGPGIDVVDEALAGTEPLFPHVPATT